VIEQYIQCIALMWFRQQCDL